MRNIIKVFRADQRRLSKNVVAIVIIMGLSILPSLYAWFNILSNWDPYGPSATGNMQIAVVSNDEGSSIYSYEINAGDKVISALEANSTIGWQFPENTEEALEGVKSGEYYAALVVPSDFSACLMSFLSGQPENPQIIYYENSKKNAIATKITSKVKNTIKGEIDKAFISTLTDIMTVSGKLVLDGDGPVNSLEGTMISKLNELDAGLTLYLNALNSVAIVTDSAIDMTENASALLPTYATVIDSGIDTINIVKTDLNANSGSIDAMAAILDSSIDAVIVSLSIINDQVNAIGINVDLSTYEKKQEEVVGKIDAIVEILNKYIDPSEPAYAQFIESYEQFKSTSAAIKTSKNNLQTDISDMKTQLSKSIVKCQTDLKNVKDYFDKDVQPKLNSTVKDIDRSLDAINNKLESINTDFDDVDSTIESYKDTISGGYESIDRTIKDIISLKNDISTLKQTILGVSVSSDFQNLINLWADNPEVLAAYISSPVMIDTDTLYEIDTYGSAMTPFYTVLALWVGALILSAIFHVTVKPDEKLTDVKSWQKYFGRYLTFFIVGQLQSILVITGNLLYVKIQCPHPGLLYLAGAVISFTFTILIYSLTYAFGNVGQAAAVIVMVIQVAGAGGTFPIEVLPNAYQIVYKFLPFVYSMNAMRECVGGRTGYDYIKYLGILQIYIVISVIVGILLGKPFQRLNGMMEKSKEQTGFM